MQKNNKLILMRHGQSEWNKQNLFQGWVDIPLSSQGIQEALNAGKIIANWPIDVIFVSNLIRAQMSAMIAMSEHKGDRVPMIVHEEHEDFKGWFEIYNEKAKKNVIPVYSSWQLNERMYGRLQGLNKQETVDIYGQEQVKIWRRSYDIAPPDGESLEMTTARTIPYFQKQIMPFFEMGKNVLVSAHGNSLRAIVKHLLNLSSEEILQVEIATGTPMVFTYNNGKWDQDQ
jgi:2,3-bisphosphoglycerate-dependent phosphoglycerate mutase